MEINWAYVVGLLCMAGVFAGWGGGNRARLWWFGALMAMTLYMSVTDQIPRQPY